jgi:hypothetical protein
MEKRFRIFPSRRRMILLALILVLPLLAWFLWNPGRDVHDGRHDRGTNAIWMQHGWLADDAWLARNGKKPAAFRDRDVIAQTAEFLKAHHFRFVYPHLCPAQANGSIAPCDSVQVERFLDGFAGFQVLPWVGGVRGGSARVADPAWRAQFGVSCATVLREHPRLAGIHVNIEPLPSGDPDFLALLAELRQSLPAGKTLSVAAYPPPTRWQPVKEVHWDEHYARAVAGRVDQVVVMMYDTGLHSSKLYEQLMKDWTREILAWYAPTQVLLGVPAYDDPGVSYHDRATENLEHAFRGIHAGLGVMPENYAGVSIYSEWEMGPEDWETLDGKFLRHP